jgi:hypothetical protein
MPVTIAVSSKGTQKPNKYDLIFDVINIDSAS